MPGSGFFLSLQLQLAGFAAQPCLSSAERESGEAAGNVLEWEEPRGHGTAVQSYRSPAPWVAARVPDVPSGAAALPLPNPWALGAVGPPRSAARALLRHSRPPGARLSFPVCLLSGGCGTERIRISYSDCR